MSLIRLCAQKSYQIYFADNYDYYDPISDIEGSKTIFTEGIKGIVFAGSASLEDWKVNLTLGKINRVKTGKIGIHSGYNTAYKSIKNQIESDFKDEPRVILTGHSSGGAIAIISALHLAALGKKVLCVTFGAPKVGSKVFADTCNQYFRHLRIENNFDLVPIVPLFGYSASGKKITKRFLWRSHHMKQYLKSC